MTPPTLYGVFAATGSVLSVLWLKARREKLGLTENRFWVSVWCLLLGGVAGAKGAFVWLGWKHYASGELRFWADFGVGFVFFGGLCGAALAGLLLARAMRVSFIRAADYFAVALPLGHALGRFGCFFQGCCHGRAPGPFGLPAHPVQLYEAAGLAAIALAAGGALARVESGRWKRGSAFAAYLALYGALRLGLDLFRGDGRPERLLGLSYQQGLALGCVVAAMFLAFINRRQAKAFPRLPVSKVTTSIRPVPR